MVNFHGVKWKMVSHMSEDISLTVCAVENKIRDEMSMCIGK